MKLYAKRSKETPSVARKVQHPLKAPQGGATAPSLATWQASSVQLPPVFGSQAGVLRVQQLKGNRAAGQMLAVQQPDETHGAVPKPNHTGLPDNLKAGVESLSGLSMDAVRVYYNSSQPGQLNALAYTQGMDVHIAPGQEKHLPHEAWHVVQQVQGRVQPTVQMNDGVPVNDDAGLEHEADVMGAQAQAVAADANPALISYRPGRPTVDVAQLALATVDPQTGPIQLDAEQWQGTDLYMWNKDQRAGEDPKDEIGSAKVFTDWCGAEATNGLFHRAHAYAKQFGGGGGRGNVAWWSGGAEDQWTPMEDRVRGDNHGGHAENWQPGVGEIGEYKVTRTLHADMAILDRYKIPIVAAFNWGLQETRAAFLALRPTLANDTQRNEADTRRKAALGQVQATASNFLDGINLVQAAGLIINDMRLCYTRKESGENPGSARQNIDDTVNNSLAVDDFGLKNDPEQVWNAMSTFQGMFNKGRQALQHTLNVRLQAPNLSQEEQTALRTNVESELKNVGIANGNPADFVPEKKDVDARFGQMMTTWRAANQVALGPVVGGWGKV